MDRRTKIKIYFWLMTGTSALISVGFAALMVAALLKYVTS